MCKIKELAELLHLYLLTLFTQLLNVIGVGAGEDIYWVILRHLLGNLETSSGTGQDIYWGILRHLLGNLETPSGTGQDIYWGILRHLVGQGKTSSRQCQ